ncbi:MULTISPECIES: hypothetical protein [unclassified Streptomyces]|uniref:hypothetical protein n=1 Tax=unclassified Streptomyces TaxID=2593676 RepID=UPI00344B9BCF
MAPHEPQPDVVSAWRHLLRSRSVRLGNYYRSFTSDNEALRLELFESNVRAPSFCANHIPRCGTSDALLLDDQHYAQISFSRHDLDIYPLCLDVHTGLRAFLTGYAEDRLVTRRHRGQGLACGCE